MKLRRKDINYGDKIVSLSIVLYLQSLGLLWLFATSLV